MNITERIDAVTAIPSLEECPPCPKSVKIEISGRCNYACSFCALRTRDRQPTKDMDFEFFQHITAEMKLAGVEEIGIFFLGESLTNPKLAIQCVEHLKYIGVPYAFLTSNASLATPEVVRGLMAASLDSLKWSVNAADEEQFQRIMGVKPKLFRDALSNIKAAKTIRDDGRYKTGLYASSIRYDGAQLEKMEALLAEHILPYVDEHYWLPLYSMAMRSPEIEKKLGYKPMHGNSGRYDPKTGLPNRDPLPCWSAFSEGHVRCDGHMSACCFGADDKFDVGDLKSQTFMEIWHGEPMRKLRRAQIETKTQGPDALKGTSCEVCVAYSG